ncbi:MAG: hypothetical protein HY794_00040 [Desulfarculus sp.]|nr:hypothetical protein [Desulfarculus sp.]
MGNFDIEATNLQTYLTTLQNIINRMAGNSSTCKTLCVTLVSAICAVAAASNKQVILWVSLLPTIIFCLLDMFYLSLEKGFREQYNEIVKKLHEGTLEVKELFIIKPPLNYLSFSRCLTTFKSWSIWLAYPGVLLVVLILFLFIK